MSEVKITKNSKSDVRVRQSPFNPEERYFGRRRRHGVWIAGVIAALCGIWLINFLVANPRWHWDVVAEHLFHSDVMAGLGRTVMLTLIAGVTGLLAGIVVAYFRMSSNPVLRILGALYIWVIRAIPPLVMLLFIYFLAALLPTINIGLPFLEPIVRIPTNDVITQMSAAIIGLTAYQAAYIGEIYRGGILSVDRGQYEASVALGMPKFTMMRRIIAPQSIRVIIPPLGNELITLFKNTSLVFVIGYTELLTSVQLIYATTYQTIPLLVVATIWYLVLTSLAMIGQWRLEKRFGKGFSRN